MAGDKFNIRVSSWWQSNSAPAQPNSSNPPLQDLLSTIAGGISGIAGIHFSALDIQNSAALSPAITNFLSLQNNNTAGNKPKAFLNWILFDEQFKFVQSSSGVDPVGGSGEFTIHTKTDLPVAKNGYLYIYVSNETPNIPVYFDNLQVTQTHGPLLEETHYYPFGLTMAGISSESAGSLENKRNKFQGQEFAHKEFSDGSGLEMYEFKYRMDDPQIGRFWQIDPLSAKYVYNSTYAFSENKVTTHIELEGLEALSTHKLQTIKDGYGNKINRTYSVNLTNSKMTAEQIYNTIGNNFAKFTKGVSYFEKVIGEENKLAVGDEFALTGGPNYHTSPVSDIKNNFPASGDQLLKTQKNYVDEATGTYYWGDIHSGVTVIGIDIRPNKSYSFTFGTWEGHVEAGEISFTATQNKYGSVFFSINSNSKSSNFFTDKAYRFLGGQQSQTQHWETFLTNLINIVGSNAREISETTKKTED